MNAEKSSEKERGPELRRTQSIMDDSENRRGELRRKQKARRQGSSEEETYENEVVEEVEEKALFGAEACFIIQEEKKRKGKI